MVASAVFVLDLKGKVLISRDYRGDIQPAAVDRFMPLILAAEESGADEEGNSGPGYAPPVLSEDGVHYLYIKHNNLYRMQSLSGFAMRALICIQCWH